MTHVLKKPKTKATLLTAFLIVFLFAPLKSAAYTPLDYVRWHSCGDNNYSANYNGRIFPIFYKICTIGSGNTEQIISSSIISSTEAIFLYANSLGYSGRQCVSNSYLEVYDIRLEMLNEKGRFPQWTNQSPSGIWSLYDPRVESFNTSSIMITDHGARWNRITMAHEMAHYWYDRLCWGKYQPDAERFAMDFERYYIRSNE